MRVNYSKINKTPNLEKVKIDYTIFFLFITFVTLCFVAENTVDALYGAMYVYHIDTNVSKVIIGICIFFAFTSLFRKVYVDRIAVALAFGAVLGLLPLIYAENVNNYWGNYIPLFISLVSYSTCMQSKIDFSDKIFKIACLVSTVLSIQIIATEFNHFSGLSFGNINDVTVKGFLKIPIGSSNLIAAFLLPLMVFIITFKRRSKLTIAVSALSMYALILCRSKNAISLAILIVLFILFKRVYGFILNDRSVDRKTKLAVLAFVTLIFGGLSILVLNVIGLVISEFKFSYYSPYTNNVLNYLDTVSSGRIVVFHNELIRISHHIFLGNGFGYNVGQNRSHNWIIEVLVQRGVIGFAIYMFCIVTVFKRARRFYNADKFTRAGIHLLSIIFIQGLFEITVFTIGIDFLIWSIAGFLFARTRFLDKSVAIPKVT